MIKIGTRGSKLALWQAYKVQKSLREIGLESTVVIIKSQGDIVLDKPLYEMGVTGVFTKTLDIALLQGEIDLAVHSMKDVPTLLPKGIAEYAVLKRGESQDVLVKNQNVIPGLRVIATGSLRRKAQWLNRFPQDQITGLRGNVITRLESLNSSHWYGAVFAKAGLERLDLLNKQAEVLDWMVPAPAQGALMIVGLENTLELKSKVAELNDTHTQREVHVERSFLREMEGGCTAPIGAKAKITGNEIVFTGTLHALDGKKEYRIDKKERFSEAHKMGQGWAREILNKGGADLIESIKHQLQK